MSWREVKQIVEQFNDVKSMPQELVAEVDRGSNLLVISDQVA